MRPRSILLDLAIGLGLLAVWWGALIAVDAAAVNELASRLITFAISASGVMAVVLAFARGRAYIAIGALLPIGVAVIAAGGMCMLGRA